jgi:capsular polysaccharide transport system permease protein
MNMADTLRTNGARDSALRTLLHGLDVQGRVIGALILRELHTRYGRDNIGYLWVIAEPMTLAVAVAAMHAGSKTHFGLDVRPVPLALCGYGVFILFRSIVNRSESTLHANQPLLYHRNVTIFDMLFARAVLEFGATVAMLATLISGACLLGLADPPTRPLVFLAGLVLMLWFSFALSLLVCSACHASRLAERLLHPVTYLLMPLSGAFFMLKWIPQPYRGWLAWFPMAQIFELIRHGQFASADDRYVNLPYVMGWCLLLTYFGLLAIRITRRHIHLH